MHPIRCDPPANCSCDPSDGSSTHCQKHPGIAKKAAWKSPRWKSPVMAIHSPLPLFATPGGFYVDSVSGIPGAPNPVVSAENLRITVQSADIAKEPAHGGRHPQPVHKASTIIRRTHCHSKSNIASVPALNPSRSGPHHRPKNQSVTVRCSLRRDKGRSKEERPRTNGRQRPPKMIPGEGIEPESRLHLRGCISGGLCPRLDRGHIEQAYRFD